MHNLLVFNKNVTNCNVYVIFQSPRMMSVEGNYRGKVRYVEVNLLLVSYLFVAALIGGVR